MYMTEDGTRRQIYYDDPRPGLKEVGVKQGTLLFDGVVDGIALSGTAFVFAKGCDPLSFAVTGELTPDGKRITLNGKALASVHNVELQGIGERSSSSTISGKCPKIFRTSRLVTRNHKCMGPNWEVD
jgi:hypothetical protein